MGKVRIDLFVVLVLAVVAASACAPNSNDYDTEEGKRQLSKLEKILGAKFPAGSKIVYAAGDERGKEVAQEHIIYSPSPAQFNRPPDAMISSETFLEILKKASVTKDLEKLKNKQTYSYEGTIGKGQWRAYQRNFESGSYLVVDQVFL